MRINPREDVWHCGRMPSVLWRDTINNVEDIQYCGDTSSTKDDVQFCGGIPSLHCGGCSLLQGTPAVLWGTPSVLNIPYSIVNPPQYGTEVTQGANKKFKRFSVSEW